MVKLVTLYYIISFKVAASKNLLATLSEDLLYGVGVFYLTLSPLVVFILVSFLLL